MPLLEAKVCLVLIVLAVRISLTSRYDQTLALFLLDPTSLPRTAARLFPLARFRRPRQLLLGYGDDDGRDVAGSGVRLLPRHVFSRGEDRADEDGVDLRATQVRRHSAASSLLP